MIIAVEIWIYSNIHSHPVLYIQRIFVLFVQIFLYLHNLTYYLLLFASNKLLQFHQRIYDIDLDTLPQILSININK